MESDPIYVNAPPSTPHPDEWIDEASKVSPLEWEEAYKKASAEAYRDGMLLMDEYIDQQWSLWELEENCQHPLQILQRNTPFRDYPYVFRAQGIVKGRAERFAWLFQDHDKDTRLLWDDKVKSVQQLETYKTQEGDIDVVKSEVVAPKWPMYNRLLLGVQSCRYNIQGTHTYSFQTAKHYYFTKYFKDTVHRNCEMVEKCMVFIWLAPMEDGLCNLKMVVCLNPGNLRGAGALLSQTYPNELIQRIRLWERVVADWKKYYPLDPKLVENRK